MALPVLWGFSWPWSGPPEVRPLKFRLDEGTQKQLTLATASGEKARFEVVVPPAHGQLAGEPPELTYVPEPDFYGQDRFTYRAVSGEDFGPSAEVVFFVTNVNDLPQAEAQTLQVERNQPTPVTLKAQDVEGDALVYHLLQGTNHGRLEGSPPFLTYHPAPGFTGQDQLIFLAEDPGGKGSEAVVRLVVLPPNQPPVAGSTLIEVQTDQTRRFALPAQDPEGAPLKVTLLEGPQQGELNDEGDGTFSYRPQPGFEGKDRFTYRVHDGRDPSETGLISIEVVGDPQKAKLLAQLSGLVEQGGIGVGASAHPDLFFGPGSYTPASVIKLATAAAALEILGPNKRFKTEVYLDQRRNLILKGYGDPGFSTDDWYALADQLKKRGLFEVPVNHLMLDLTAYELRHDFDGRSRGIEPYYAPIGPMVTNENLASVQIERRGRLISLDARLPLTETVRDKTRGMPQGPAQFNLARTPKEGARYSLDVAAKVFQEKGLQLSGRVRFGEAPEGMRPLLVYEGKKTVNQLVERMLHKSSNYIANQLVMALSMHVYGPPARLGRGVYLLEDFLERKVGLEAQSFDLAEGSGLSRRNRVSLGGMLKLVNYFERYADLLPTAAQSHHAELLFGGAKVRLKSGTLSGISNLIGYIELKSGGTKPFVIFLNDRKELRGQLLRLLMQAYGGA